MSVGLIAGTNGAGLTVPRPLFRLAPRAEPRWELSRDGNLFLINELADPIGTVRPYNVLTGWKEKLESAQQ
jgi:hypothetical protein